MTMCTFKKIAVSNWALYGRFHPGCGKSDYVRFLTNLMIQEQSPDLLILREKELIEPAYTSLLGQVKREFRTTGVSAGTLLAHGYLGAAVRQQCTGLHLPLDRWRKYLQQEKTAGELGQISCLGTSVHSVEEALEAEKLGASYLLAGHIFSTECKPGVPPRGLEFLKEVCEKVGIPVYAIGGIREHNLKQVQAVGAAGACQMSEYMREGGSCI